MSCCDLSVFMEDFNHYFKRFFEHAPTEAQLKNARSDWRAGNTGYEGAHNADYRAKAEIVKANERLVNIGGNNYAHEGSDLARRYQESNK